MNSPETRPDTEPADAMEVRERLVSLHTINLLELSRLAIRGVFGNNVTPEEAVGVAQDLAWHLKENVNPDFQPDMRAIEAGMKQQPYNENAYAVRLTEGMSEADRHTDTLIELSASCIRLVSDGYMTLDQATDTTEDLFYFVHQQLSDSFQPDIDRAVETVRANAQGRYKNGMIVSLHGEVASHHGYAGNGNHTKTQTRTQVGNRYINGQYTDGFPN